MLCMRPGRKASKATGWLRWWWQLSKVLVLVDLLLLLLRLQLLLLQLLLGLGLTLTLVILHLLSSPQLVPRMATGAAMAITLTTATGLAAAAQCATVTGLAMARAKAKAKAKAKVKAKVILMRCPARSATGFVILLSFVPRRMGHTQAMFRLLCMQGKNGARLSLGARGPPTTRVLIFARRRR